MNTIVIEAKQCPNCGKLMASGALEGLCPACLLAQGAAAPNLAREKHRFVPPSIGEIQRLFPQLEVGSLLGAGGMGAVYKARQPSLDRWVALKILPADDSSGVNFAERFNREARALARLSHPNIVAVHEFGHAGGLHFFIMEFVDGANLRQLEQAGRLSPREALQIIPQICDALQYAHDEGVVHRDIKPENVLVDRKGKVKIADFGLAKILGQETDGQRLTIEGQVMGTPHYMAPEQVERPLSVDHRADIYALGVVFYEMLTGDLPIGKFPPPSRKVQLDVRLDDVVLRALENDPARRYQNASEVKSQVETIAGAPLKSQTTQTNTPAPPPQQSLHWAGFPVVVQRDGLRRVNWKAALLAFAILFGLLTIPFGFISAFTGRSVMGWLGIIGWPSVVARALICVLLLGFGIRRAFRQTAGPTGTVLLAHRPWWRRRRVILPAIALLMAVWAVFQAKRLASGLSGPVHRSGFEVAQVAKLDSKSGRLIAKLPGRGTVEILAIGETNAEPGGWWTPDGSVLKDADYEVPNPVQNSMTGYSSKDILVRVRDLPSGASSAGIRAGPEFGVASGAQVFRGGKPLAGAYQARVSCKPSLKNSSLQMGFGLEPWRTIATISADGSHQNQTRGQGDLNWRVRFHHQPTDTAAGAEVAFLFGPESPMWLHQVTAVDTNGVKHSARTGRGTHIEKMILWTHTFDGLRLSALKEFRVQVRPVHWVEFPEVALTPRTAAPPAEPRTFGPALEISFDAIIDFDSGTTRAFPYAMPSPETLSLSSFADNAVWMEKNGFDAAAGHSDLQPLDMDFVLLQDSDWEALGVPELLRRVYGNYYHPRVVKPEKGSRTFGFRTREHGAGILQFADHPSGKSGVTLRYKLVQRRSSAKSRSDTSGLQNSETDREDETPRQGNGPDGATAFRGSAPELDESPQLRFLAWQGDGRTSQPKGAWHLDGSEVSAPTEIALLEGLLPAEMDARAAYPGKLQPHFLHLWISHPLLNLLGLNRVVILDARGVPLKMGANGSIASRVSAAEERPDGMGWFMCTLSPSESNQTPARVTVQFDYAVGPLERTKEVAPDFQGAMSLEGNSQLNGIGQRADGKSFIALSVDARGAASRHFGVLAITHDAREVAPSSMSTSGHLGSGTRVEQFEFNVPLRDVSRFRIGTRPVRTKQWQDVVIRPARTP